MKILFVKTSSLGDVVHNCPAVSDAARAFPGAEIDWVVEEAFAAVPAMHARVRRVIPVALRRWRRELARPAAWSEFSAFRRALAAERYDAVVDSQGLMKSVFICKLASGTLHGLDRASARDRLAPCFYDRTYNVPWSLHAVERNRMLSARALGYETSEPPDYCLRESRQRQQPPAPYAVFLTMTSRAEKLWPEARWSELARTLGTRVVLPWGDAAEQARARRIAAGLADALVPPHMSLEELGSLFLGASHVVGVDTGLTHLAAALDARTLGIYCGTDPAKYGLLARNAANVGGEGRPPAVEEVVRGLA